MPSRFRIGSVVATPAALETFLQSEIATALGRHARGDWGDVDREDARANEIALHDGTRLLSAFEFSGNRKLWIITEADRTSTCVLLPSDY